MLPEVFVSKTHKRKDFVDSVMESFSKEFSGKKVFVKPNIVSHENYPTTTHPETLEAVLSFLERSGCETGVGDGPAPDAGKSHRIIEDHPLNRTCAAFDIELVNLHECMFLKKRAGGSTLTVSSIPFDYEYIISLPVLKCHQNTGLTGALKNQFGYLRTRERILMHGRIRNIHKGIANLNLILKPGITIMDAIQTYRRANEARHGGVMAELGWMLAGKDPVALDCAGLELLSGIENSLKGRGWKDIEHIRLSKQLGVGSVEFRKIGL
jgi:uncharacterized protein (DUF362 family)